MLQQGDARCVSSINLRCYHYKGDFIRHSTLKDMDPKTQSKPHYVG